MGENSPLRSTSILLPFLRQLQFSNHFNNLLKRQFTVRLNVLIFPTKKLPSHSTFFYERCLALQNVKVNIDENDWNKSEAFVDRQTDTMHKLERECRELVISPIQRLFSVDYYKLFHAFVFIRGIRWNGGNKPAPPGRRKQLILCDN